MSFALAGCAAQSLTTRAERDELRKLLSPRFATASIPVERTEDFYRVLQVWAKKRDPSVLVEGVLFESLDRIVLLVADEQLRKGGSITLDQRHGVWTVPTSNPLGLLANVPN
jgi:hypothetical protein